MSLYLQRMVQQRDCAIRFIRAMENGLTCWFYLKLNPETRAEYERKFRNGYLNIRDYGRILESDWGEYPPDNVVQFMRDEYGFNTPPQSGS